MKLKTRYIITKFQIKWYTRKFLGLIGILILTSCATKRDWQASHYKNINAAAEAKILCDSGQNQAAKKLGYTCYPRDKDGNIINRSVSTSNGNVSNIYINGYNGQNRAPANDFYNVFKSVYEQERADRLNRICTFNGTCQGASR